MLNSDTCRKLRFGTDFHVVLLVLLLTLTGAGAGMASSTISEYSTAERLEPGTDLRGYAGQADTDRMFLLEVPGPGIVSLDLMTTALDEEPAVIELASQECGKPEQPSEAAILEQSPTHLAFATRTPGRWWFRASAQDPDGHLGLYRLVSSFTPARVREETFEAVSGRGTFLSRTDFYALGTATKKAELEIVDPDPGTNPLVLESGGGRLLASLLDLMPGGPETKAELEIVDPDPGTLRAAAAAVTDQVIFYEPACAPADVHDDHGDTARCATPLRFGENITGEVGNAWHDDADVFSLSLAELVTVEVTTAGSADTVLTLHDGFGQRLAADDDGGEGLSSRIVTTLAPGRYFVRVSGGEGAYEIKVATWSR